MKYLYLFICFCLFACHFNNDKKDTIDNNLQSIKFKLNTLNIAEKDSLKFAIENCNKIQYKNGLALAYSILGQIYEKEKKYDSAIHYFLNALANYTSLNDSIYMANTCINIANQYGNLKEQNLRLKYLTQAKVLLQNSKSAKQVIRNLNDIGVYYAENKMPSLAKIHFYKAMVLSSESRDTQLLSTSLINIANILNEENNDSALKYYRQCVKLNFQLKNYAEIGKVYNNMAEFYWQRENRDSVKKYLMKSADLMNLYPSELEKEKLYDDLAYYYEEDGNFTKSIAFLRLRDSVKSNIYSKQLTHNIANIEKDYTVKLKSEENAKLGAELKRKNTLRNGAIIMSFLLGLLGLYQYRNYKQKRKLVENEKQIKDQEIEQLLKEKELKNMDALFEGREEERKRIGRDLHDRLGSMLSTVKLHFSAIETRIDDLKKDNQTQYNKATALLDEAVGEVRKIAHDLVSGTLVNNGLSAAIYEMKQTIEESGKLKINIFETGKLENKNIEFEIAIYRVIQELISNVVKHSAATKVDIHLTQTDHDFTLIVEDNGKGYDVDIENLNGIGMANVKQRVEKLGGIVNIDTKLGKGTSVIIEIGETKNDINV